MQLVYPQLDGVKIEQDRSLPFALIQAIRKLYDYVAQSGIAPSGGGLTVTDEVLRQATTTFNPPNSGSDWVVIARQDATGGRAIAWGLNVIAASTAIDTTANTLSVFRFIRTGIDWIMAGQPTTGMTL